MNRLTTAVPALLGAGTMFLCAVTMAESTPAPEAAANALSELRTKLESRIAAEPENTELKKQLLQLSAMQRRETMFARERNPELAARLGAELRRYYYRQRLFAAAEPVDRRLHALKPDHHHTFALGETLLQLGKNQEAAELLKRCDWSDSERSGKLLTALAAARAGDPDTARRHLAEIPDERCTPQERLLAVTAAARLGEVERAATGVKTILEQAPARETRALRRYFSGPDFQQVLATPAFRNALNTESKVQTDDCTGCPNRGTSRCDNSDDCR